MAQGKRRGPLARLWACRRVERIARRAGRLDARASLGELTLRGLRRARHDAAAAGCRQTDIDESVFCGLDSGRGQVQAANLSPRSGAQAPGAAEQGRFPWS